MRDQNGGEIQLEDYSDLLEKFPDRYQWVENLKDKHNQQGRVSWSDIYDQMGHGARIGK